MCYLIIFVLLLLHPRGVVSAGNVPDYGIHSCQDKNSCVVDVSACADENGNLMLELVCNHTDGRSMVVVADRIQSARLSRNVTDHCVHKKTDTFYKPNTSEKMMKCLWRKRTCRFQDKYMKDLYYLRLRDQANYMIAVNFQCVEEERVIDICSKSNSIENIQMDYGYIVSPKYPNKYHKGTSCRKVISNDGFYANISLSIKTLDIQKSSPCDKSSQEYIKLRSLQPGDRWSEEYYCAEDGRKLPLDIQLMAYQVEIVFRRSGVAANKGFRIDFQVHNASEPTEGIFTQGITGITSETVLSQSLKSRSLIPSKADTVVLNNVHIIFITVTSVFFLCIVIGVFVIFIQCLRKRRVQHSIREVSEHVKTSANKDVSVNSIPDIADSLLNSKQEKDNESIHTLERGYL